MYIKLNYDSNWLFYGSWNEVKVTYGCIREKQKEHLPTVFSPPNGKFGSCDEIFEEPSPINENDGKYTVISGWDKAGIYKSIALLGCPVFLLSDEGKLLEQIIT